MLDYSIKEINNLNVSALERLSEEALSENHSFVKRAVDEWKNGINSFSKPGEKLWGIFIDNKCIAIGGLNQDPYMKDKNIGRVRHLYVFPKYRRRGLAKILIKKIIDEAKENFTILRLSTDNPVAASLYESMGFTKQNEHKATHVLHVK